MDNFIKACIDGDNEEIRWFLKYYPRQWGVHCKGKIGLMFAAENGRAHSVRLLLELNSDIHAFDHQHMNALLWAAKGGQHKVVAFLLENGARPQSQDNLAWTAFHMAAENGDTKSMEKLLEYAPELLDQRTKQNLTPLWLAVTHGNEAAVRLLLDRGADIRKENEIRDMVATALQNNDHAVVKMINEEPRRRQEALEQEISDATDNGLSKQFTVKSPVRLVKKKPREESQTNTDPEKTTPEHAVFGQKGARFRGKP